MGISSGISAESSNRTARNLAFRISRSGGAGIDDGSGTLENTFTPCGNRGEILSFGTWPTEPDGPAEPLQWRVIGEGADGSRLLVSLSSLESRRAHDHDGDVTWQHASIRYWLHKVFMPHAFTPQEALRIRPVHLVTFDNKEYRMVGCRGTDDFVFLLSEGEARRFFATDRARAASCTSYASRLSSVPCWWLRSPGGNQFAFQFVNERGVIDTNGFHSTLDCVGIRPALILSPQKGERKDILDSPYFGQRVPYDAGHDLEYDDRNAFLDDISAGPLTPKQARIAVCGGYPSVKLINSLLDKDVFGVRDRYHLCQAAITCKENTLAKRLISQTDFDNTLTVSLLNTCMSEGAVELAEFLVANGANGSGYARAYLPTAKSEATAICAVTVDPEGALVQWRHVKRYPLALRTLVAKTKETRRSPQSLLALPGFLTICAEQRFMEEIRSLTERPHENLTAESLLEAIQAAKAANHPEVVAYLLDRQTTLFAAGSRFKEKPVVEIPDKTTGKTPDEAETPPTTTRRRASSANRPNLEL